MTSNSDPTTASGTPPERRKIVDFFGPLFRNLRPHSKFAVDQAVAVQKFRGIGGTLVIQIHPDADKPPECYFSTAPSSLVSELWKAG